MLLKPVTKHYVLQDLVQRLLQQSDFIGIYYKSLTLVILFCKVCKRWIIRRHCFGNGSMTCQSRCKVADKSY